MSIIYSCHTNVLFNLYFSPLQATHGRLQQNSEDHLQMFQAALAQKLPNIDTFAEAAVMNVFSIFIRKVCNTRIQEFLSATKQELATKKGLASTIDLNLRTTLIAYHTKLESQSASDLM